MTEKSWREYPDGSPEQRVAAKRERAELMARELQRRHEDLVTADTEGEYWPANRFKWPVRDRLPDDVKLDATLAEDDVLSIDWDLVVWWNTDLAQAAWRGWKQSSSGAKLLSTPVTADLVEQMFARVPRSAERCTTHLEHALGHLLRAKRLTDSTSVFMLYDSRTGVWRKEGEWVSPDQVGASVNSIIDRLLSEFASAMDRACNLMEDSVRELTRAEARPAAGATAEELAPWDDLELARAELLRRCESARKMARALPHGAYQRVKNSLRERLGVESKRWDSDTRWLILRDGMIDLPETCASGRVVIMDFSPFAWSTMAVDAAWSEVERLREAGTLEDSEWEQGVRKVLPDNAVRRYLQVRFGIALLGTPGKAGKTMVWQYGEPDTAKSTIQECVAGANGVFAPYAMHSSSSALTEAGERSGASNRFKAYARGKRFVILSELKEGAYLDTEIVKSVTGGETVEGTAKFENAVEHFFTATLFMGSNHAPKYPPGDVALAGRIDVVPFRKKLWLRNKFPREWEANPDARADVDWQERILSSEVERAAVLSWVVEGLLEFGRSGIGETPPAMSDAKQDFEADADPASALARSLLGTEPGWEDRAWLRVYTDREWDAAGLADGDGLPVDRVKAMVEARARQVGLVDEFGSVPEKTVRSACRVLSDMGGLRKKVLIPGERRTRFAFARVGLAAGVTDAEVDAALREVSGGILGAFERPVGGA